MANQDFVQIEDNYKRNKAFIGLHNVEYVIWRNAHHAHQSDMGFLNGNVFNKCKNSHLSKIMFDLNFLAMEQFLNGKKVEGTFGEKDLGRNYTP